MVISSLKRADDLIHVYLNNYLIIQLLRIPPFGLYEFIDKI